MLIRIGLKLALDLQRLAVGLRALLIRIGLKLKAESNEDQTV